MISCWPSGHKFKTHEQHMSAHPKCKEAYEQHKKDVNKVFERIKGEDGSRNNGISKR